MTSPSTSGMFVAMQDDPVRSYVAGVGNLHDKLSRIVANQREVADSLARAVAALRSLAVS